MTNQAVHDAINKADVKLSSVRKAVAEYKIMSTAINNTTDALRAANIRQYREHQYEIAEFLGRRMATAFLWAAFEAAEAVGFCFDDGHAVVASVPHEARPESWSWRHWADRFVEDMDQFSEPNLISVIRWQAVLFTGQPLPPSERDIAMETAI